MNFKFNVCIVSVSFSLLLLILGSQLSAEPTFHWVLYEPNIEQSPMEITKHNSDPFPANTVLSPRWNGGGLQIIREQDSISYCAGLIISQLRQSLGFYQHKVRYATFVKLDI